MKALVTGGSGFIGSHIVDKLRARDIDVYIYDLRPPTYQSDVTFIEGSILNLERLVEAVAHVDAVFHTAAVADVKDVLLNPLDADSVNVRGTAHVLEAARLSSKANRVIFSSTTWVYGDSEDNEVDEATALGPPSHLYTATKVAGEHYCKAYKSLYGLDATILRFGIPYGPRARDGAVVPIFVNKALRKEALTVEGDGSQFRKFVYVEDLAEGAVKALAPAAANKTYNLDGAERISIKRIAESVRDLIGDVPIDYKPGRRPGDFSGKNVSSELALAELGWRASTRFEDGLSRYVDWYRSRLATRERSAVRAP